jgi:hypothetical protein
MEEIEIFVISCRRILFYAVSRILNNPHYYHMMISIQTFSMPREGFCNLNVSSYFLVGLQIQNKECDATR